MVSKCAVKQRVGCKTANGLILGILKRRIDFYFHGEEILQERHLVALERVVLTAI